MNAVEVTVTCASAEQAGAIVRALVDRRLVACGQWWPISSCYRWQGEIVTDSEVLVTLKTLDRHTDAVIEMIRELHSYDVPAVAVVALTGVGPDVVEWLDESTGG